MILLAVGFAVGLLVQRQLHAQHETAPGIPASLISAAPILAPTAPTSIASDTIIGKLANDLAVSLKTSRSVLLGSRDPNGTSCVTTIIHGQLGQALPPSPADLDGGPGTKLATLYYLDRQRTCKNAKDDFVWHQTRLRTYLTNEQALNQSAQELAHKLAETALQLHDELDDATNWPDNIEPIAGYSQTDNWPSYCLTALNESVASKNLRATRHWAGELAAATFALEDLHRWLVFLYGNHLAALDFQAHCQSLFDSAVATNQPYDLMSTMGQLPAGALSMGGISNYYEVEHQAEQLFATPKPPLTQLANNETYLTADSIWLPPNLRECFVKLGQTLSPENRANWNLSAHTPYEHSYLVNMLYREWTADHAEHLAISLHRFDENSPHAKLPELLGVLMYRGNSFAGLEWDDRFLPPLMQAASQINGSDTEAFMAACQWVNQFYKSNTQYTTTFTLRDALDEKKLDCVRATDMIGAIFRDAGRTRFGHVRWSSETSGHSVAAYIGSKDNKPVILLADAMNPPQQLETWPQAYFHGHAWPAGLENNAPPFCAELYVRGIDNYIWAEGYIIRGPNAGLLSRAGIPYFPSRSEATNQTIFAGPYPQ